MSKGVIVVSFESACVGEEGRSSLNRLPLPLCALEDLDVTIRNVAVNDSFFLE